MGRPITLFTGQWADLPLEDVARKASEFGYHGLELACWGDHFEVDKALSDDGYCANRRDLLERYDLQVHAISAHLVGQAVLDRIDERHQAILPAARVGRRQTLRRQHPRGRRAQADSPRRPAAGRGRRQRLQRLEHLAPAVFVSADARRHDRGRLRVVRRAVQSDSRRVRRMRRAVRAGSASDRDCFRPDHGRPSAGGGRSSRGVRIQFRSQPPDLARGRSGRIHPRVSRSHLSRPRQGRHRSASTGAAESSAATCRLAIPDAAGSFAHPAAAASISRKSCGP